MLETRVQREHKIVQSIQSLLRNRSDIVIRRTDKSKVFYIGNATDFAGKAEEYMLKTNACQEPGTPLRLIIASIHAPATLVSKFLNDLLAPIYLNVAREVTFINGIDVIRKLEKHVLDGHFQATTNFIVIDVTDLYRMIPREGALHALMRLLKKHSDHGKIGTLSIDAIMRMARLVLDTNCFAYDNKYYKQTRGGAMGFTFTQALANIYMREWEQDLIQHQVVHNGIYGRFVKHLLNEKC
ncbi:unnamed protein product [Rotaria sp. Silwood2]|nr:unnamed protein product [Rotaria sp. Silwood2]